MDVQEDLYDEFGNYIGPEIDSDDDADAPEIEDGDEDENEDEEREVVGIGGGALMEEVGGGEDESRVVLHEDKKYYPTAMEVYGEEVETTVQDEDTQPITQGVVAAIKAKNFDIVEKKLPTHVYSQEFLVSMMRHPNMVRNVAIIGHLHHGKTTLVDMLVDQTHYFEARESKAEATQKEDRRYTDSRVDEQQRGLSIKASPITMLLQASSEKHFLFNLMDTPGHVNFSDEATAGMRLADGCLLVVDVVEGLMLNAERLLRHAVQERLPVVLCVNKMDRLPLELKLPPQDAYFKIRQVIEEVNSLLSSVSGGAHAVQKWQWHGPTPLARQLLPPAFSHPQLTRARPARRVAGRYPRLSPEEGNVIFAASSMNWSFTLKVRRRLEPNHLPLERSRLAPTHPTVFCRDLRRRASDGRPEHLRAPAS